MKMQQKLSFENKTTVQTTQKRRPAPAVFRLGLLALLAFGAGACLDQINLDVPRGIEETLVIQGSVIQGDPSVISVNVSRLFDFTSNSVQPANVRSVILRDETGRELTIPTPELGLYEIRLPAGDPRMPIEAGKSYQLTVNTFDDRVYVSSFETILAVPKADSLSSRVFTKEVPDGMGGFVDRSFIEYGVHTATTTSETGPRPYLRWVMERSYRLTDGSAFSLSEPKTCYITQRTDADNIRLLDPTSVNADRLHNLTIFEDLINFYYAEGHYLTVYQQAINEGAHRYWDQISNIVDRTGNMFEPPAGKINSNFENPNDPNDEAFGYFFVTQQDNLCPPAKEQSPDGSCPFKMCCDCLSEPGSSIRKPDFWMQ